MTTRFLSRYDNHIAMIRLPVIEEYATGGSKVLQTEILAIFKAEDVRPHERELALAKFSFRGLYQEMDEVTTVPPDYRIGLYDSEQAQRDRGWPDDVREDVERALIKSAEDGTGDILVAPRASVPPPWPNYDDYQGTKQKLGQKLISEGHDLQRVLTYERESQNRPQVTEMLEALIADPNVSDELALEEVVG